MGREDAVVEDEVDARAGHEHSEPFQQLDRLEQESRRAVCPLGLEGQEHAPVGGAREALLGDRGPQDVAGELLEPVAIVRRDGDVGVEVEAVEMGLARAGGRDPGNARHATDLQHPCPGAWPEGHAALDGCARDPGQCLRRLDQGIGRVVRLRLAEDATPPQQPQDAGADGGEQPPDLRVGGRWGRVKPEGAIRRLGEDAVECERGR